MASLNTDSTLALQQCSTLGLDFPWMTSSPGAHLSDGTLATPSPLGSANFPVGYTSSPFGKPWYHDLPREDLLPAAGSLMDLLQGRAGEAWGSRESMGEYLDRSVAATSLRSQSPLSGMVPVSMYSSRAESGLIKREGLFLSDDSTVDIATESSRLSIASSGYHSSLSPSASDSVDSPPPVVADADEGYGDVGSPPVSNHLQQAVPTLDPIAVKIEGVKRAQAALQDDVDVEHRIQNANHAAMDDGHARGVAHMGTVGDCIPTGAAQKRLTTAPCIKGEFEKPTSKTTMTTLAPPAKKVDVSAKPAVTYIELVARALISAKDHKLILADIYAFILQNYPYYETAPKTWRNAVRHNLCVNDCFYKAERSNSGRGFFWAIHPACIQMFKQGDFRRTQARRLAQQTANTKVASSAVNQATRGTTATSPNPGHHLSISQGQQYQIATTQMVSGPGTNQVIRMTIQHQQPPSHMYQLAPYSTYGTSAYGSSHGPMVSGNNYQYYHLYNGPTSSTPATDSQSYYATPMYR